MECRDTKLLIEAGWDRRLPPESAAQLERHLEACPGCRAEYGPVTRLLTSPEPVAVPARLRERIMAAIQPLPIPVVERSPSRLRLRRCLEGMHAPWAGAVAACLIFAFLGWVGFQIPIRERLAVNPGYLTPAFAQESGPLLAAGWVQTLAVPGPGGPLAAVAQGTALAALMDAPDAELAAFVRGRPHLSALSPTDSTPVLQELQSIAVRLSRLGT